MPFHRKILYYGLMLLLTLLVLEGMGRIAYYAAYGQWYGGGGSVAPANSPPPMPPSDNAMPARATHPYYGFYGFSRHPAYAELNAMPPRPRREDTVLIGLLGGSVGEQVKPFLQRALNRWFADNRLPRQAVVLELAISAAKQPQQTMIVANTLLLGGEFDLIVNLDGFNELSGSIKENSELSGFPFFPPYWHKLEELTTEEILLAGNIGSLRRKQARLMAVRETSPLRPSALFGLANRYRSERTAAQIIQRNHELAAAAADYRLEKHGPRIRWATAAAAFAETARFWYRSSLMLAQLAELSGAEYYHFLQPNQYVPNSKPLSPQEQKLVAKDLSGDKLSVGQGYQFLQEFNQDLPRQGINYFDLTRIFVDHPETLYIDDCCHLNDRGNELLAAALVQRLAPALLRLGRDNRIAAVSALAAARLPTDGPAPPTTPDFQVSLLDDGKHLRYVREVCATEDTVPRFFLHLIPQDVSALSPRRREQGFDNFDFSFAEVGGQFAERQCAAQFPLPDYPIKEMRTGQHIPGQGDLWSVQLIAAPDPAQLRADYAALSAAEPAARDYFDLYAPDNRLIYLRETCAPADTAAAFFLHLIPEQLTDLPADRRAAGFVHEGFDFARQGGHFDGKCLAAIPLPDYPIREIRTGQHIPGQGNLWLVQLIAAPNLDQLRADYAALAAEPPAARDYFDLYRRDNRLIYLRETCAAADTAAGFFLHIVPENPADLPQERRDAGFAHAGFDFVRQGGHFDGKCLASVALPNYPIKAVRTGQHIPGQGDLWSAQLIAAP